ncbi:lysylphosphatidylglycerol synthase domain-containing protein [Alkalilimnicola sp. S0819]|uniref:lysylphosphatidylglycerol synthase domain-containing protein n=1 Tax=Alkalilimnicola sp. S0819 TaxID=2613922 RepID=UPI0012616D2F|nr:lysylphosphatidylglycerol synthase domain-containing protein [Alkalilimnicola sp. S0819]KAB7627665.1 UPF0104 family protein [Alkalilimnicola sp. S0819]MPQ15832.1 hypothetical protein [Alkalilimnicola sp. S0819]
MRLSAGKRQVLRQLGLIVLALLVIGLLIQALGGIEFGRVLTELRAMPAEALLYAVLLTVPAYACLLAYEALALAFLGRRLPVARLVAVSLAAFALQRNVGPAPVTGGSLRYRYYRPCGFSVGDAVSITLLCGFAFTLGIVATTGMALLLEPQAVSALLPLRDLAWRLLGLLLLMGLAGYLYWSHRRRMPLRFRNWQAPTPELRISAAQVLVGVMDIALVAAVLYVLLPAGTGVDYPAFVGLYVLAMLVGALSHVPGGIGVFEATLALMLPGTETHELLAAMLAFRGVYYLLPLGLAGLGVGGHELGRWLLRR